jgi:hypothetical protein
VVDALRRKSGRIPLLSHIPHVAEAFAVNFLSSGDAGCRRHAA